MPSTTAKLRSAGTAVVLLAALTLAGCGGKSTPTPTSTASRPSTNAKLEILEPTANEKTGRQVKLVVKLTGAQVVAQTAGKLTGDKGHIHVSLDGQLVSMAYGTTQDLNDLAVGQHTLQAEFVAIDHAPFRNRVIASVLFTVTA